MALMERIVRPHSPVDTGPSKLTPKCRDPFETTTVKYHAPPGMDQYGFELGYQGDVSRPKVQLKDSPKIPDLQEKTLNSSWAYAYKKYMTKKEKEVSKPAKQKDGVVQDKKATKEPQDKCAGAGGESTGASSGPTTTPPSVPAPRMTPTLA